jgi:pectate lyase
MRPFALRRIAAFCSLASLSFPVWSGSASFDPVTQILSIAEISVEGSPTVYQGVRLRLDSLGQITVHDDRVHRFHFDPQTQVLTLPAVVVGQTAHAGVRLEGLRFSDVQATGAAPATVKAFPRAAGFGAIATGGRGGRVITVTNLNASGPGSLQDALDQTGPRTVVFAVSGLIDAPIHLTRGDVTIAGQTAPAGIAVRQFHTTEEPYCDQDLICINGSRRADNWILQHVRIRPDGQQDDGLRLRYTRRAIVDQVSIGGATDEAVEISYSNDVTLQNTLIAETVGSHADRGGVLVNYSNPAQGYALTRLSLYGNTFNRILGRYPELSREGRHLAGEVMDIDISNNLYWDMGYFIDINNTTISASDEGEPIYYRLNLAENHAVVRKPGQPEAFQFGFIHIARPIGNAPQTSTWFSGNRIDLYPDRRDYQLLYCCNDYPQHTPEAGLPSFARATRHDFPFLPLAKAGDLPALAYLRAGAFPRDPMDMRLMGAVGSGQIALVPRDRNPVGDGSFLPEIMLLPVIIPDSDSDGMPDHWETAQGLNPHVQDHNGQDLSMRYFGVQGYTNLEVYLALLSEQRIREQAMRGLY